MTTPIISLNNVSYRYPHSDAAAVPALADINLDVAPGEFVGLIGANGCGKSTLARLLNGLALPTTGEVQVDGLSTTVHANLNRIRETLGMVFQNPDSQIVATSVEDDIAFGPENLGLPPQEIEHRIAKACKEFGLEELRQTEPHWLSGGQKQRTVLAGVSALEPKVLVLDEPTSMLDPRSQRRFRGYVEQLWQNGTTVIYITQIMEEIATAPRVVALSGGKIAFDGAPADFFSRSELLHETRLEPPLAARVSAALAMRGQEKSGASTEDMMRRQPPLALTLPELVKQVCT